MSELSCQLYPFDLDAEQEARAANLHDASIIIDLLFQGPLSTLNYPADLALKAEDALGRGLAPMQLVMQAMFEPALEAAGGKLPAFGQAWLRSGVTGGNRQVVPEPLDLALKSYGLAQRQFDCCDWLIKALKAEDFRRAKAQGKVAGYLSTQSGPGTKLDDIEVGYSLGLRMIQLTYNSLTPVGAGCTERVDSGLSRFGVRCVEKMNELGIIVDTGHCGRRTTLDACEFSSRPVIASHTAVNALHPHDRCKSDEEIKAIAATGGVVGIVTVPFFLAAGEATIEHFLDHVDYVRELVGIEHVAVGTDWPLSVPASLMQTAFVDLVGEVGFREEHGLDPLATLKGFSTYLDFPNITRGLVSRGYSDEEIKSVLGENALRVFEDVCG